MYISWLTTESFQILLFFEIVYIVYCSAGSTHHVCHPNVRSFLALRRAAEREERLVHLVEEAMSKVVDEKRKDDDDDGDDGGGGGVGGVMDEEGGVVGWFWQYTCMPS